MRDILSLGIREIREGAQSGRLRAREVAEAYLIRAQQNSCNEYITLCTDELLDGADRLDAEGFSGQKLFAVPMGVKDNISTKGIETTCASRMLRGYVPVYDAFCVEALRAEGALICGKCNMDEFAMGARGDRSAWGAVKNPRSAELVCGGSSAGSAAAVGAGSALAALGSDTGGSVRLPAAYCGVVGLKGTYGAISRRGLIAFASGLDCIGVLARSAADAAEVFESVAVPDALDATNAGHVYRGLSKRAAQSVRGLRVGVLDSASAAPGMRCALQRAAQELEKAGCVVREAEKVNMDEALAAYYVISAAEASSNLARYDGLRFSRRAEGYEGLKDMYMRTRTEGFGAEVKKRILLGTWVLSEGCEDKLYERAWAGRRRVRAAFERLFCEYDILLSPAARGEAPRFGDAVDEDEVYREDTFTVPQSLAGLPAVSVPFGGEKGQRTFGVQISGRHFEEELILRAASALERCNE